MKVRGDNRSMGTTRFTQQQRDVLWAAALNYRTALQERVLDGEGAGAAIDLAVLERAMKKLLDYTPAPSDPEYVAARIYDGSFPLEWLRPGEFVRRGPKGEADIEAQDGTLLHRIAVGERVP